MKRCDEVLDAIARMAIDPAESRPEDPGAIERHLSSCPACSKEATSIRRAIGMLQEEGSPDPGPAYWAAFLPRLRARITTATRRSAMRAVLSVAAAAVVLVAVGVVMLRQTEHLPGRGGSVPPVTTVSEDRAEARLESYLERASEVDEDRRVLESVLEDLVPIDPLEIDGAVGALTAEEVESLAWELSATEG